MSLSVAAPFKQPLLSRLGLTTSLVVFALVCVAVSPALLVMSAMWSTAEYSHAWLITPLAVLIFIERFAAAPRGGNRWLGPLFVIPAVVLLLAGWITNNTTLSIYGGILGLYGVIWAALGHRAMWSLTAPIGFLFFMIPLPLAAYITLSQSMQLVSSKIGVALMSGLGVVVVRDGNVIELANGSLEVAEACSGLRYLFPLLSISFLLAVLMEKQWWKKLLVFLSAFPIALVMNAVRLAVIGWLVDHYGMGMAEGFQHEVEGFAVFVLCIGLLVIEVYALSGARSALAIDRLIPDRRSLGALAGWPSPRPFWLASVVLAAGALTVISLPPRVETIPERRALSLFPMTLAGWEGTPSALDAKVLGSLRLTDYVMADYVNPTEAGTGPVNFYVAYYESQHIGVQVHSPRLCIPGGGWTITQQSVIEVPAADGSKIPTNRVVIERQGVKQLVYYWFDERGRLSTGETENKWNALVDAVMLNRSDGALIRVVVQIHDGDEMQAERSLQSLILATSGKIRPFVPA